MGKDLDKWKRVERVEYQRKGTDTPTARSTKIIIFCAVIGVIGISVLGWALRTLEVWWYTTQVWLWVHFSWLTPLLAIAVIGGVLYGLYHLLFGKW